MVDDDQIVKSRDDALSGRIYVDHEEEDDIIKLKSKDDSHLCTQFVVEKESGQHDSIFDVDLDDIVYTTHNPSTP